EEEALVAEGEDWRGVSHRRRDDHRAKAHREVRRGDPSQQRPLCLRRTLSGAEDHPANHACGVQHDERRYGEYVQLLAIAGFGNRADGPECGEFARDRQWREHVPHQRAEQRNDRPVGSRERRCWSWASPHSRETRAGLESTFYEYHPDPVCPAPHRKETARGPCPLDGLVGAPHSLVRRLDAQLMPGVVERNDAAFPQGDAQGAIDFLQVESLDLVGQGELNVMEILRPDGQLGEGGHHAHGPPTRADGDRSLVAAGVKRLAEVRLQERAAEIAVMPAAEVNNQVDGPWSRAWSALDLGNHHGNVVDKLEGNRVWTGWRGALAMDRHG